MKTIKPLVATILFASFGAYGQSTLKTKSVSVFKNGSSFFVKEGQVTVENGSCFLEDEVPKAAFGTLWFSASNGEINQVRTHSKTTREVQETKSVFKSSAFGPMLEANLNKRLTLFFHNESSLSGTVEKVDDSYFLFKTGTKWINLKTANLERIEFSEKPVFPDSVSIQKDTIVKEKQGLMINFSSNSKSQDLGMMYLQKGIGWVPTYSIDLYSEDRAKLRLQAVVSNQAEDFENADLNFVVGVPNFLHQNDVTPLSKSGLQSINQFYNSIPVIGNSLVSDFANRGGGRITYGINAESNALQGSNEGLEGFASEDLFFYNLPNVSLKRGESAQFNILRSDIKVQHIYEVQLEENSTDSYYYRQLGVKGDFSFGENFKNKVWHAIKFKNTTNSPLTGGAVMVTNSQDGTPRPISQDKITYTPAGAETFLKLTVAPDVSVRDKEKQKEVEEVKEQINGYWYNKITVEGEIRIQNYKSKKVNLNIRKKITGELESSNVKWLKSKRVQGYQQQNEITDVCWELTDLQPGEKRTIKYVYEILVRR